MNAKPWWLLIVLSAALSLTACDETPHVDYDQCSTAYKDLLFDKGIPDNITATALEVNVDEYEDYTDVVAEFSQTWHYGTTRYVVSMERTEAWLDSLNDLWDPDADTPCTIYMYDDSVM